MQIRIYINGMACGHCKNSVETALKSLKEVQNAVVDLEEKCATVELNGEIDLKLLTDTITDIGFEVEKII